MKKFILIPAFGIQLALAGHYKVEHASEVNDFLGNAASAPASILKTKNRAYSERDMNQKVAYLKTLGFQAVKKSVDGEKILHSNEGKDQVLGYDQATSSYFYHNDKVDWFPKGRSMDTKSLDAIAETHLTGLLGDEAKNFVLANKARTGMMSSDEDGERDVSVSYIYNRKHKGRVIHGSTNQIQLEIAAEGNIRSLYIEDRDLVELKSNMRLARKSKVPDLLSKKMGADDPTMNKIKGVKYLKGVDSYFQKRSGSEILLVPHVSFYTETDLLDNESVKSWEHVSVAAEDNSELGESDMEGTAPTK